MEECGLDGLHQLHEPLTGNRRTEVAFEDKLCIGTLFCIERIDLVEHHHAGGVGDSEFGENLFYGIVMGQRFFGGAVNDVQEQVGFDHFFQGRAKRLNQVLRKGTNEPDRIGKDDLSVPREAHPTTRGVEGCEQLVLGVHGGPSHAVEEGGLPSIGVANDADHGKTHPLAPLASQSAVFSELAELLLDPFEALICSSSVDFESGLTRTSTADSACESRHGCGHHCKSWSSVPKLGKFDLEFSLSGLRPNREDVQDELGSVQHLEGRVRRNVSELRRGEFSIENQHICPEVHAPKQCILELSFAHKAA